MRTLPFWRKLKDKDIIQCILRDEFTKLANIPIWLPGDSAHENFVAAKVPAEYHYAGCRYMILKDKDQSIVYNKLYITDQKEVLYVENIVNLEQPTPCEFVHFKKLSDDTMDAPRYQPKPPFWRIMDNDKSNEEYANIIAIILKDGVACKSICKAGAHECCWECNDWNDCDHRCDICMDADAVASIFSPPYDHCDNSINLEDYARKKF